VLGTGVDLVYPAEHAALAERVARAGGLLSEYPPGTRARQGHFPRRNRLVAALGQAVVVVEAGSRSGALGTAAIANELGREVLAVPGPVTRTSHRGCHRLLRDGVAGLCEGAFDVLRVLGLDRGPDAEAPRAAAPGAGAPLAVFGVLEDDEVVGADEICRRCGLSAGEVAAALTTLELDGHVARVPGVGVRRV
jgi:DNA processing protein